MSLYRHTDRDGDLLGIDEATDGVWVHVNRETVNVPAEERQAAAQALAGDEYRAVPARAATVDPDSLDLMHVDLGRILDALGLPVIARPYSPHECVTRDVLPAIEQMMDDAYRWRCSETLQDARDTEVQAAQPDRPEPVDPASVRKGDIVDYETTVEYRMCRIMGEVEDATEHVTGEDGRSLKIHGHWWNCNIATVRILHRPEPEPDEAAVEALREVYYAAEYAVLEPDGEIESGKHIRELAKRGVRVVNE